MKKCNRNKWIALWMSVVLFCTMMPLNLWASDMENSVVSETEEESVLIDKNGTDVIKEPIVEIGTETSEEDMAFDEKPNSSNQEENVEDQTVGASKDVRIINSNEPKIAQSVYSVTYHVGPFAWNIDDWSVTLDGKKYYFADDIDDTIDFNAITKKLVGKENQNVLYELHENKIVEIYTMDEIFYPTVKVEPSIKDGVTY